MNVIKKNLKGQEVVFWYVFVSSHSFRLCLVVRGKHRPLALENAALPKMLIVW